jgi:hypothetical protein
MFESLMFFKKQKDLNMAFSLRLCVSAVKWVVI